MAAYLAACHHIIYHISDMCYSLMANKIVVVCCSSCEICTGVVVSFGVERTVYTERRPVLNAASCRSAAGSRRTPCKSDGRRPSRCLHGSHPRVPGARRETEGAQGRLG